jgi:hypothetical protein
LKKVALLCFYTQPPSISQASKFCMTNLLESMEVNFQCLLAMSNYAHSHS